MGMVDVAQESVGLVPKLKIRVIQRGPQWCAFPFLQDLVVRDVEGMTADLHVHVTDFLPDVHENGEELPLEG